MGMYDDAERSGLAFDLARAMLAGPWRLDAVAEAIAAHLLQWPSWLDPLALHVVSVYRRAPATGPGALAIVIEAFLAERRAGPEGPELEPASRPTTATPAPRLRHDWPIAGIPSTTALAEALELSDGQLAWLADVRSLERT